MPTGGVGLHIGGNPQNGYDYYDGQKRDSYGNHNYHRLKKYSFHQHMNFPAIHTGGLPENIIKYQWLFRLIHHSANFSASDTSSLRYCVFIYFSISLPPNRKTLNLIGVPFVIIYLPSLSTTSILPTSKLNNS